MPVPTLRAWRHIAVVLLALSACLAALVAGWPARPLTGGETAALRDAFGTDAALASVRIVCLPLPPALTGLTAGSRVVFRSGYCRPDFSVDPLPMSQLVHEVAHVRAWQREGLGALAGAVLEHLRYGESVYVRVPGAGEDRQERSARLAEERWLRVHLALAATPSPTAARTSTGISR